MTAKSNPNSKPQKELPQNYNPLQLENETRIFWQQNNTQAKLEDYRLKNNIGSLGYVEGPPTLNGIPHVGHARGRVMKDLHYRLKTMQSYYIPFWAGWDTQGLPVELEVEKQLGVRNKRELLENISTEKFIQECKKAIQKYHKMWQNVDQKLAVSINHNKAYWTYKDEYIEREWHILKAAWDQDLLEEGYYIVPYCPGCQTSLSSAEVGYEGAYQTVEDPSLYFKFKLADTENDYLLVWTTMPFTLITDTMLAVHPNAEYSRIKVNNEKWILAKQRVQPVMQELKIQEYQILETVTGKDLEGRPYEYPFKDLVPKQIELEKQHPIIHKIITEDFVDINTATGVVHQSPGNGEEDFQAAQKRGVPIYSPYDDEVKFTAEAGAFQGKFARDTDRLVIEQLKKLGLLVNAKIIKHEYPTCWRSHHKLVWLARKEYFLRTDKISKKILEAAEKVNYYYEPPKNRFLSFLREGKPWCISRERVWGAPLPIWKCENCSHKIIVDSKKELLEKAQQEPPSDFELHKPWVDRITFKCPKCSGIMYREDYVLDAWHNSGAAPYARFTDEEYEKYVPVDFLTEAMDQTRGWANTLLLEHVILTEKPEPPYKAFLLQGLTQDARGRKMSKSLGNVIEATKALDTYSADVFRFYVLRKCPPIDSNDFDPQELNRRPYQVLSTLYHLNRFFAENAQFDGFSPEKHTLQWAAQQDQIKKVDKWLLSRLQQTIQEYTRKLDNAQYNLALAYIEDYTIETLSRLYVPMVRKELWSDDSQTTNRRLAIYTILHTVLKTLTLLFNPITPHLTEAIYQRIYRKLDATLPETISLEDWPRPETKFRDQSLEEQFDALFKIVSLANAARQTARLKRRWPLNRMIITAPKQTLDRISEFEDILLELANVKQVQHSEKMAIPEGFAIATEGDTQVAVDKTRDDKLLGEGIMRDLARRVQALRKELGYSPTDVLDAVYISDLDKESIALLDPYLNKMAELVRSHKACLYSNKQKIQATWHQCQFEDKSIGIAIIKK